MVAQADRLVNYVRRIAVHAGAAPSDAELLATFVAGTDPRAFEEIVRRHGPLVLRVCQRVLGNVHDAEDAFQATFLVLARKAASVQPPGSLSAWLHGVAARVALGARSAARRRQCERLNSEMRALDPQPDPLAEVSVREALRILEEEVQRLPEKYRLPLVLCCLHGVTQEDAARQLGWTPGSVKGRLERGRRRLHCRLARRGLGLATAFGLFEVSRATAAGPSATLLAATVSAAHSANTTAACLAAAEVNALAGAELTRTALAKAIVGLVLLVAAASLVTAWAAYGVAHDEGTPETPVAQEPGRAEPSVAANGEKLTRIDQYGDVMPVGAVARHGSARLTQGGPVSGLAFSPDSKVVASCGGDYAGEDGAIHLWDVATGKEVGKLTGHKHVRSVCFSPAGKLLASASFSPSVCVWDVASGKVRYRCGEGARLPAFSHDGKRLATLARTNDGYSATVWAAETGGPIRTWSWAGKDHEIWSVELSPDGATLATAGAENRLHLWDVATATERHSIQVESAKQYPRPLAFAPDSSAVALANDDGTIGRWIPATGRALPALRGHKAHLKRLAFADGGKTLMSAGADRTVRFWNLDTATELHSTAIAVERGDDPWVMALAPNAKVLATGSSWSFSNVIRLFDASTGKPLHVRDGHAGPVEAVGFLPQGDVVSVGGPRVVRLTDAGTGKERYRSPAHPSNGLSMILSQEHQDRVIFSPLTMSPDRSLLAVAGRAGPNGSAPVRVWDLKSDRETGSFTGACDSVLCLAYSPDKKTLALACWDKSIRLWDTVAKKEVRRLDGHQKTIFALEVSPDGKLLASASLDQTVRVWELATGQELYQLRHDDGVLAVAFSPDGRTLTSAGGKHIGADAGDTSVRLWEIATGQERDRLRGTHHLVKSLAFAANGKLLALGSSDATVRVWDPMLGTELRRFDGHRGMINALAFSRDGRRLVSGSTDTSVIIWDTGALWSRSLPVAKLAAAEREAQWRDLAGADAAAAYRAMRRLLADREASVRFLQVQLQPIPTIDTRQIERWVADLDAEDFTVRENATAALRKLGEMAEPTLRRALVNRPSLEFRRRAESLLRALMPVSSPDALRAVRSVETLEQLATPLARELLAKLERGAPAARLTREAAAALSRLNAK